MTSLRFRLTVWKTMLGFGSDDNAPTFPQLAHELKITALSHAKSPLANIPRGAGLAPSEQRAPPHRKHPNFRHQYQFPPIKDIASKLQQAAPAEKTEMPRQFASAPQAAAQPLAKPSAMQHQHLA
jgi:hypothetical protein